MISCSHSLVQPEMRYLYCPWKQDQCGSYQQTLTIQRGQTKTLNVTHLNGQEADVCWWQVQVDKTALRNAFLHLNESEIFEHSYIEVQVNTTEYSNIYLNSGDSVKSANNFTLATAGETHSFRVNQSNYVYILFKPESWDTNMLTSTIAHFSLKVDHIIELQEIAIEAIEKELVTPDYDATIFWILLGVALGIGTLLAVGVLVFICIYNFENEHELDFDMRKRKTFKIREAHTFQQINQEKKSEHSAAEERKSH